MLQAFALSFQADDRLRACLRNIFPLTDTEPLIAESGRALRDKMFDLFVRDIDPSGKLGRRPNAIERV